MQITLDQLFHGDRTTLCKINPGDAETLATISVATLKEIVLAIMVINERVTETHNDVVNVEKRIDELEEER